MESHFAEDDIISQEQGFNAAVAFTDWSDDTEPILDPSIGELYFTALEWGLDDQGAFFVNRTKLDTHFCTAEELGLVEGNSRFMPIHKTSQYHVK